MPTAWRCPECRTRRSTLPLLRAHVAASGHKLCNCGGYHYAHRPGSPYCSCNPIADLWVAQRQGEGPDVLREIAAYLGAAPPAHANAARGFIDKYVN